MRRRESHSLEMVLVSSLERGEKQRRKQVTDSLRCVSASARHSRASKEKKENRLGDPCLLYGPFPCERAPP